MLYQGWNDYELIYLIKEGNERALNLMYLKYENLIRFKAQSCGFRALDFDDCVQEGLLLLTEALHKYNEAYNKTFYKYYELILLRYFWRLRAKDRLIVSYDAEAIKPIAALNDNVKEYSSLFDDELRYIYNEVFIYNTKIKDIALSLGLKTSQIYYKLKKIKEILRQEFDLL